MATGISRRGGRAFSAMVSEWSRSSEARLTATFRSSVQALANEVRVPKAKGGNMPVDTGNLRRSLVASNSEMPTMDQYRRGTRQQYADRSGNISATIAATPLGGRVYLGFQASYAAIQERLNGFVRLAAQRWPQIVAEQSRALQTRASRRR